MRKWSLFIILSLLSAQTFALQLKSVVDNETTSAKISSVDVTRIFVQGDRIKSLKGIKGAYTRENDEKNGEVYIQPLPAYQHSAFTVLIETEKGRHFTLLLNPVAVPSESLMLVPKGVGSEQAARFETSEPYQLTLAHLIQAMTKNSVPEGYQVREVNSKKCAKLGNIAVFSLKTVYQGLNLRGEILELTNSKPYVITLNESSFYQPGTRAVSFASTSVKPHGKTYVYRISSHV